MHTHAYTTRIMHMHTPIKMLVIPCPKDRFLFGRAMVIHQYPSSCLRKKRQSRKRIWLPQLSSLANLLLMRCSRSHGLLFLPHHVPPLCPDHSSFIPCIHLMAPHENPPFLFRILLISVEEMQRRFEKEALPFLARGADKDHVLSLLEYCCFETLAMVRKRPRYLKDESFRRLSFDMMLAWEDPHSVASSRKVMYIYCLPLIIQ
jgi:hypothetical protein